MWDTRVCSSKKINKYLYIKIKIKNKNNKYIYIIKSLKYGNIQNL